MIKQWLSKIKETLWYKHEDVSSQSSSDALKCSTSPPTFDYSDQMRIEEQQKWLDETFVGNYFVNRFKGVYFYGKVLKIINTKFCMPHFYSTVVMIDDIGNERIFRTSYVMNELRTIDDDIAKELELYNSRIMQEFEKCIKNIVDGTMSVKQGYDTAREIVDMRYKCNAV